MSKQIEPTVGFIYDPAMTETPPVPEFSAMSDWDLQLAKNFCQHICEGLTAKAAIDKMADDDEEFSYFKINNKIRRWKAHFNFFRQMIEISKIERTDQMEEDILDIADDATDDATMSNSGPVINGKAIRRAEIMINTRKFVMAKSNPKKYGDKSQMEITGKDGKDLAPAVVNVQLIPAGAFLSQEQAERFSNAGGDDLNDDTVEQEPSNT
jgi:hypothetical protein